MLFRFLVFLVLVSDHRYIVDPSCQANKGTTPDLRPRCPHPSMVGKPSSPFMLALPSFSATNLLQTCRGIYLFVSQK